MSLDEFFERLPKDGWVLGARGQVRTENNCCPVEVCAGLTKPYHFAEASSILGIGDPDVLGIAKAADNDEGHDPALRGPTVGALRINGDPLAEI